MTDDHRIAEILGAVDDVWLAFVDLPGRLQGKRCSVDYFKASVADHGSNACDYLLSVDIDMAPQVGFAMSGWSQGFGDMVLVPDLTSLRMAGWRERTAICFADAQWPDGSPVVQSPRQILQRQLARLAERGWTASAATELEFIAHLDSYAQAADCGWSDLRPVSRHNIDYSLLGLESAGSLVDRMCAELPVSGLRLEVAKGEANLGQLELNFRYDEPIRTADGHALFKHAAKAIAEQEGQSVTFMAKLDEREGNSCHVHLSLADEHGNAVFGADEPLFRQWVAGQLACMQDLTLLFAPNVNSYKRFASESFAPTRVAWGEDNRTCSVRAVGSGSSRRMEHRLPGADANPYLVIAAVIAAGLHGVDHGLQPPPPQTASAYTAADAQGLPTSIGAAVDAFASSSFTREAFGDEVVDHLARAGEIERDLFAAAVTDWERRRGYERS